MASVSRFAGHRWRAVRSKVSPEKMGWWVITETLRPTDIGVKDINQSAKQRLSFAKESQFYSVRMKKGQDPLMSGSAMTGREIPRRRLAERRAEIISSWLTTQK